MRKGIESLGRGPAARHARRRLWMALLVAFVGVAPVAAAQLLDRGQPTTVVIGPPPGYAPQPRLGPTRLGRAPSALPSEPREIWRHELPGALDFPPVVDAAGGVVAVTTNRLVVRVRADGSQHWRASLGKFTAALPPLLTSEGGLAVVCGDGRVRRLGRTGTLRVGAPLAIHTAKAQACPLALDDGGLAVAGERQLLRLDSRDRPVARAWVEAPPVGGVLQWRDSLLVTLEDGSVVRWHSPAPPRVVAHLGGAPVGGGTLIGPDSLAAVVDGAQVVTVDLRSGRSRPLVGGPGEGRQFDGPVVLDGRGRVLVASVVGLLLAFDRRGAVAQQLALENEALIFDADAGAPLPALFRKVELDPSPPLLADHDGRIAFVRASGRVGVIVTTAGTGQRRIASPRFCGKPLVVLPAGPGRMLVACKNGSLGMFADG